MSTLVKRFQMSGARRGGLSPEIDRPSQIPQISMCPEYDREPHQPSFRLESGQRGASPLARFDLQLRELSDGQRRVLRLMLTGARLALVSGAAGESRTVVSRWLGAERVFLPALHAVQRDLDPTARARLHGYVTRELMWEN
ncbi:MAG TPA: hypothetical protein VKD22_13170, partial [Ramlibacter sp.]|nr:hypothetical protein [Ramlibacter sp.]